MTAATHYRFTELNAQKEALEDAQRQAQRFDHIPDQNQKVSLLADCIDWADYKNKIEEKLETVLKQMEAL